MVCHIECHPLPCHTTYRTMHACTVRAHAQSRTAVIRYLRPVNRTPAAGHPIGRAQLGRVITITQPCTQLLNRIPIRRIEIYCRIYSTVSDYTHTRSAYRTPISMRICHLHSISPFFWRARVQIGHPSPLPPCQVSSPPRPSYSTYSPRSEYRARQSGGRRLLQHRLLSTRLAAVQHRTAPSFPLSLDHDRTLSQACHA